LDIEVGISTKMKFTVLDDVALAPKILLCMLCGIGCCWGFVNNAVLLVFASKVGFPMAVVICAVKNNLKNLAHLIVYVITLVAVGCLYFYQVQVVLDPELTKNFVPTATDFVIAIGLGMALNYFWDHVTRINIIVMIAGMASLLPACVMAGYWASSAQWNNMADGLLLWGEYAVGIFIGSTMIEKIYE
jgi:hypothetical protein